MPTYKTLNNREIEYAEPTSDVATFLQRVQNASVNTATTYDELLTLIYGDENPLLERDLLTGRAIVTASVLAHPVFRILVDLLGVKAVKVGKIDLSAAHAKYTVSVTDAAKQLSMTAQAVRAAIEAWRLPAVYRSGQWWLQPDSIASYNVSNRRNSGRPASSGRAK